MRKPIPMLKTLTMGQGKFQETVDLEAIWRAEYDNVAEAAETLPGLISWLCYWKADCIEKVERSKRLYDEAEAEAYFELRGGQFETDGFAGKPTEEALKKAVVLRPSVRGAAQVLEKAMNEKEVVNGVLLAIQAKLDLVRTTEATKRRIQEPTPVRDEDVERAG
jgi:hypothetical protein